MSDPFAAFRAAIEKHDTDAAVALFADDVRFYSPVVHKPYVGRDELHPILTAVAEVFEDFRYTDTYSSDDGCILGFTAVVGDRELQGIDMLRATDGLLTELTVMVRPYSAATALRERMAALLPPA